MEQPLVGVLMGSLSDFEVMRGCLDTLAKLGIPYEVDVSSAHRSPDKTARYAAAARERGLRVIVVGAGAAAHLGGVVAAHTTLPVVGVPIDSSPLQGMDALLATVQMPPGVPVATMAVGKAGARNAAVFAAQVLALADPALAARLDRFKGEQADAVAEQSRQLREQLAPGGGA
ncbi:MAG TPA: 5-(carboxyamino)imidazole ribonucleotide mutase [Acidobacteriota bacterium]|nr:5-(carboxyamino)imidazole ribonucleotide mutase [Acidobacteriota bacterium]HQM64104.1 5-(carboxyamino)imidazole ribonucleotide mutase [Acidobacteriota bacterium]